MKHFPKAVPLSGEKKVFQFWFQKSEKKQPQRAFLKFTPFRLKPQQQYPLTIIYSQKVILLPNMPFKTCNTSSYQHWVLNLVSPSVRTEASLLHQDCSRESCTKVVKTWNLSWAFSASHNSKMRHNTVSRSVDIWQGQRKYFPLLSTQLEPPEKSSNWPNALKITK